MSHVATLCRSCPGAGDGLAEALAEALAPLGIDLRRTECMSGCTRPVTLAFRAPGKTAYLFGEIGRADLDDIRAFARLYRASPDGTVADARPLGTLRTKAIARIPG